MRMAHIYQPVMLIELLSNKGQSTVRNIAKAILSKDESQIEYYEHITKNMVGRVLTKKRGITEKDKNNYSLIGFNELSQKENKSFHHKIKFYNFAKLVFTKLKLELGKNAVNALVESLQIICSFFVVDMTRCQV